jgi:hypothetical protein
MAFVARSDEYAEAQVARGSCDGKIVRGDHAPAAAQQREKFRPFLRDRSVEFHDAGDGKQSVDALTPSVRALPVSSQCNSHEQLAVDGGRQGDRFIASFAKRFLPGGAGALEGDERAGVDY